MAITNIDTWMLRFPSNRAARERADEFFELIGVTVQDESSHTGTGWTFTSDYGGGEAVVALLDTVLVKHVIGRDPMEVETLNDELWHLTHRLGHGITSMAIAAIDIALWDLRARRRGVSLARELGQVRDTVPAYGSGKASPSLPLDELVELSVGYVTAGFNAVKLRVGRQPELDDLRVAAVRKAIGPEVRIMCDANERLDLPAALRLGRKLAEHDIYWLEEPLLTQDLESYRRLRAALPMAIAMGEHIFAARDFLPYITSGAVDVVQPDMCLIGGVTQAMRAGRIADAHGLALAPHFMTDLHVHIAAALPRATYVEFYPFMDDLLAEGLAIKDGAVVVPSRPGHGVRFTKDSLQRYLVPAGGNPDEAMERLCSV
ncbi:MAG: mandelate racemase/muconate lactonizing enzyme family protein [Betaproteobacteria bacterium]